MARAACAAPRPYTFAPSAGCGSSWRHAGRPLTVTCSTPTGPSWVTGPGATVHRTLPRRAARTTGAMASGGGTGRPCMGERSPVRAGRAAVGAAPLVSCLRPAMSNRPIRRRRGRPPHGATRRHAPRYHGAACHGATRHDDDAAHARAHGGARTHAAGTRPLTPVTLFWGFSGMVLWFGVGGGSLGVCYWRWCCGGEAGAFCGDVAVGVEGCFEGAGEG